MADLHKITNKKHSSTNVVCLDEQSAGFSLEELSDNLKLSPGRSKALHILYKKNDSLKKESTKLVKALNEEKYMAHLQSEFVSLVSHEFRNPLSIIKSTADVLKRIYDSDKSNKLYLQQIQKIDKAVLRMNKLIESTLNLSRLESGKIEFNPTSFCLKALILEIIERYQDISSGIKFSIDIDTKGVLFNGDKNLIDQVFTNLISNAIKYSNTTPKIIIKGFVEDNIFVISIKDNGIGISKADLKKLFIKYFRSKRTMGTAGTGIGLYLVKQFIKLHHGKIIAKSELNKGSEFILYLPT